MLGTNTLEDILVLPMHGDRQLFRFVRTRTTIRGEVHGRSLGRLRVERFGRAKVYIALFTPPGSADCGQSREPVSRDGGSTPVWRDEGREVIFGSALLGVPMAVEITPTGPGFRPALRFGVSPPRFHGGDARRQALSRVDAATAGGAAPDHRLRRGVRQPSDDQRSRTFTSRMRTMPTAAAKPRSDSRSRRAALALLREPLRDLFALRRELLNRQRRVDFAHRGPHRIGHRQWLPRGPEHDVQVP